MYSTLRKEKTKKPSNKSLQLSPKTTLAKWGLRSEELLWPYSCGGATELYVIFVQDLSCSRKGVRSRWTLSRRIIYSYERISSYVAFSRGDTPISAWSTLQGSTDGHGEAWRPWYLSFGFREALTGVCRRVLVSLQ